MWIAKRKKFARVGCDPGVQQHERRYAPSTADRPLAPLARRIRRTRAARVDASSAPVDVGALPAIPCNTCNLFTGRRRQLTTVAGRAAASWAQPYAAQQVQPHVSQHWQHCSTALVRTMMEWLIKTPPLSDTSTSARLAANPARLAKACCLQQPAACATLPRLRPPCCWRAFTFVFFCAGLQIGEGLQEKN